METTTFQPAGMQHKHRLPALSSSSESSDESQPKKPNEWQYIGRVKRKKLLITPKDLQPSLPETSNRYSALMDDAPSPDIHERTKPKHTPKPPPIYVHGVLNYAEMNKSITEVAEEEHFCTKNPHKQRNQNFMHYS